MAKKNIARDAGGDFGLQETHGGPWHRQVSLLALGDMIKCRTGSQSGDSPKFTIQDLGVDLFALQPSYKINRC